MKKGKNWKKGGLFKKIFFILFILFVLGVVGGVVIFVVMVLDVLLLDENKLKMFYLLIIYDKNGKEVVEVGVEKCIYVLIDEIFDVVKEVFIVIEDVCFYEYYGIDFVCIGGVLVVNFKDGFGVEGGSIII